MDPALMEARLRAFYAEHNAGNQQNIAEIVRKFAGREAQLCAKLRKKYGAAPDLSPPESRREKAETADASAYQREYKPYKLASSAGGALDLRSPAFDALRALGAASVTLLESRAFPLDNIQKCRPLLPASDPNRQSAPVRAKKLQTEAATRPSSTNAPSRSPAREPTLFELLADTYLEGPFTLLRDCFLQRKRVLVVVRRVNSVRGSCSGLLKAFDKHLNLLLMDVTLESVPLAAHERMLHEVRDGLRAPADAVFSSASRARNRRKGVPVERAYHRQLFLRGDNVVSISYAPPTVKR